MKKNKLDALLETKEKQEEVSDTNEDTAVPPALTGIQRFYHRYGVDYRSIYALNKRKL